MFIFWEKKIWNIDCSVFPDCPPHVQSILCIHKLFDLIYKKKVPREKCSFCVSKVCVFLLFVVIVKLENY